MRTAVSHSPSTKVRMIFAWFILGTAAGCSPGSMPDPVFGQAIVETCPARNSEHYFFAPRSISHQRVVDDRLRSDFTYLLTAMNGEPLWCGDESPEAFRFIWLPARVQPIIITATKLAEGWKFHTAEYSVTPVETPDQRAVSRIRLSKQSERAVTENAGHELTHALEAANFWTAPPFAGGGDDGYVSTIEGRINGRYRVVTRWNASDSAFEEAARVFVRLSGLPLPTQMQP